MTAPTEDLNTGTSPGAKPSKTTGRLTLDLPRDVMERLTADGHAAGLPKAAILRALVDAYLADIDFALDIIETARAGTHRPRYRQPVSDHQRAQVLTLHTQGHSIASIARTLIGLSPSTIKRVLDENPTTVIEAPASTYDPTDGYGHRRPRRWSPPTAHPDEDPTTEATVHRLPTRPAVTPQVATPDGLRDPQ